MNEVVQIRCSVFVCDCEKLKMYWMYIGFCGKKQAGKDVPKMCRRINQRFLKNAVIYIQRDEYESGKGYFAEGMNIKLFDDEMQICPGVKAITLGGHSKGSCIVEITDNGRKSIIAGDECYLHECLDKRIPTGSSYCPDKSRQFIDTYGSGEYTVLLCHDK